MCLGTVAKVVDVIDEGRAVVAHATLVDGAVQHTGRREDVLKMTVGDDIRAGDWVVIHSGFVLERISASRAIDALAIRGTEPSPAPPPTAPPTAPPALPAAHTPATTAAPAASQHKEMAP